MNILSNFFFLANEVTIKPVKKKLTCVEGKKKCNPRCTVTKTAGVSYTKYLTFKNSKKLTNPVILIKASLGDKKVMFSISLSK